MQSGEATGRLGRAEADRRASVCMHTCRCLCVHDHMRVLLCSCTSVLECVVSFIHGTECECRLTHTQSFKDLLHRSQKHKQIKQAGQGKNKGGSTAPQPGSPRTAPAPAPSETAATVWVCNPEAKLARRGEVFPSVPSAGASCFSQKPFL